MRNLLRTLVLAVIVCGASAAERAPNVVLIFADDLGYADLSCTGATAYKTPHLDSLAKDGTRFSRFYVAQAVCSASRAALLTGCYPNRIGIAGALFPNSKTGINANEVTLAEMLKSRGYKTGMMGKWHLGDLPQFLPTRNGFDEYFGLPYSNDMIPKSGPKFPPLPLIDGEKPVEFDPDQTKLTGSYAQRAVKFIDAAKDQPFFLHVAHSMPHVPLYASAAFAGKSGGGLYGDVITEIDASVGEILAALKRNGVEENTLVIFTSDNGPWLIFGNHGGSAGPLREGKGTAWEGGMRVPCLMRWPGKIPAGRVCDEPLMTIDIFPTLARLTGATLPAHKIDGKDVWPILAGEAGAKHPQEAYYFYYSPNELRAVVSGQWKMVLPHGFQHPEPRGADGKPGKNNRVQAPAALYDLTKDIGETTDVQAQNPEVFERLTKLAEACREDLGDSLTQRKGTGTREPGRVE